MDNFDVFTVITLLVTDLETLCALRSTHPDLRNFIDSNLNNFGISADVIDFQNFIYEYSCVRPTLKPRILDSRKLLEISLEYNDIPGIVSRKHLLEPRDIAKCISEESLIIVCDNLEEFKSRQYGVSVPFIECDNPKKYYEYIQTKFPSWMIFWNLIIQGMMKYTKVTDELGSICDILGIDKRSVYDCRFASLSNILWLPENRVLEILKSNSEIISEHLFYIFVRSHAEYTKVTEYFISISPLCVNDSRFEDAVDCGNWSISKTMAPLVKNVNFIQLRPFRYNSSIIVEVLYLVRNARGFLNFCSQVLMNYIPYKRDISVYHAIRELVGDSILDSLDYSLINHPLQWAYLIKYLGADPDCYKDCSKEMNRKYEFYLTVI